MAALCSVAYGISEFDNVCCRQCRTDVCLSALRTVSLPIRRFLVQLHVFYKSEMQLFYFCFYNEMIELYRIYYNYNIWCGKNQWKSRLFLKKSFGFNRIRHDSTFCIVCFTKKCKKDGTINFSNLRRFSTKPCIFHIIDILCRMCYNNQNVFTRRGSYATGAFFEAVHF